MAISLKKRKMRKGYLYMTKNEKYVLEIDDTFDYGKEPLPKTEKDREIEEKLDKMFGFKKD